MSTWIIRSLFVSTHFTEDETEARRPARGLSSQSQERAGTVHSMMVHEVVGAHPPPINNQKSKLIGKKNLLNDNGELTKQGRMAAKI